MTDFNTTDKPLLYTIVYRYPEHSPLYQYMYVPEEDWMIVNESVGMQEEPLEIAAVIRYEVEPVEKDNQSLWINNWQVR